LYLQDSVDASVLSPQTWPFDLALLPPTTYLVGGSVRDALLDRVADYLDLDFVLPTQAVETAKLIANRYRAGFVLLDAERYIARVMFEKATVDFAQQVGDSLEADLHRRDFTVNAIAYHPKTERLIDPLQGYADLQRRSIRMIAAENLKEDPLRLLRAYRQAAQLDFVLEPHTQATIQQLAGLLAWVAAERVQAELNYLLSTAKGTPLITLAWQDGLFDHWLPHLTPLKLQQLARVDQAAIDLENRWADGGLELSAWRRDQPRMSGTRRSWLKVAKLACLVASDSNTAEQTLWQLKYSRVEIQAVLTVLRWLPHLHTLCPELPLRQQYGLFKDVGSVFPALTVMAVAMGTPIEAIAPLMQRFLNPQDPVAHRVPLLTGRDLMSGFRLSAGPHIGHLLETIQLAQAEGKISTRQDALEFVKQLIDQDSPSSL
jgi:tRNA nucleotidyltransferase (CCA-adding enzyme)